MKKSISIHMCVLPVSVLPLRVKANACCALKIIMWAAGQINTVINRHSSQEQAESKRDIFRSAVISNS